MPKEKLLPPSKLGIWEIAKAEAVPEFAKAVPEFELASIAFNWRTLTASVGAAPSDIPDNTAVVGEPTFLLSIAE